MSISTHDRRVLDAIRTRLSGSDPGLAGLMDIFARLSAGEQMPEREQISRAWFGRAYGRRKSAPARGQVWLGSARVMMFVWLLVSAILVSVALALTSSGGACNGVAALGCARPAPAVSAHPSHP